MPLRVSPKRPTKPTVPPIRGYPGSGFALAKCDTSTPLGISTASPPRYSTTTLRASGETAIRAVIFSIVGCSSPCAAASAQDRPVAKWKVATKGRSASARAINDRLGEAGSCRRAGRNRGH